MTRACVLLVLAGPLWSGCNTPTNQPTPRTRTSPAKTPEALEADRKAAEIRRARDVRIEALCTQPAKRTASPDEACARMVDAHQQTLDAGKTTPPSASAIAARRALLTEACIERPLAVVLCQANVLETIAAADRDLLTEALNRCTEKFADA